MTFAEYGESRNVKATAAYNYAMYLHKDLFEGHYTKEGRTISIDDEAVAMLDEHFAGKKAKKDGKEKNNTRKGKKSDQSDSKVKAVKTENGIKMVKRGRPKKTYEEHVQLEKSMLDKPIDELSALKDEIARLKAENEKLRQDNLKLGREVETNEDKLVEAAHQLEHNNLYFNDVATHLANNEVLFEHITKTADVRKFELTLSYAINNKDKESIQELALTLWSLVDHMHRVEEELGMDEDDYDPCEGCDGDCETCDDIGMGDD